MRPYASSFSAIRVKPVCGIWNARSATSAARSRAVMPKEKSPIASNHAGGDRRASRCTEIPCRRGYRRTHQSSGRGCRTRVDPSWRRRIVHRSRTHAGRQQGPHHDGPARLGDAGIGSGRAHLGRVGTRPPTESTPNLSRLATSMSTSPPARSPRTGPSAGITMASALLSMLTGTTRQAEPGDDRRDHAGRPGAAHRRNQREGSRGQTQRDPPK